MSSDTEFDFEAMMAQGEAAGVQVLYLLIMTPLPVTGTQPAISGGAPVPPGFGVIAIGSREEAERIARDEPCHSMGWRHNTVMAWRPKFGSLVEVLGAMTGAGG